MALDIVNSEERERSRDAGAASELSQLISGLKLGDDALTAEEYENFPSEQEVSHVSVFC